MESMQYQGISENMKKVELVEQFQTSYALNEAYKSIRTNLLFCGKDVKVITVTSCIENEGKSAFTVELAKNLATVDKRVLLLDADLRKSVLVGKYTKEANLMGLSQYLSGQVELSDVLYQTQFEGVDVIFAGQYPPNPVDLLSSEAFGQLLDYGREHYDYVLIDTPPLGLVIDSAVVCALSDGAILVIRSDAVGYRFALDVKEQIQRSGCHLLGAVLSQVKTGNSSHYYGKYGSYRRYGGKYGRYSYGYGYGYGYGQDPNQSPEKMKTKGKK